MPAWFGWSARSRKGSRSCRRSTRRRLCERNDGAITDLDFVHFEAELDNLAPGLVTEDVAALNGWHHAADKVQIGAADRHAVTLMTGSRHTDARSIRATKLNVARVHMVEAGTKCFMTRCRNGRLICWRLTQQAMQNV